MNIEFLFRLQMILHCVTSILSYLYIVVFPVCLVAFVHVCMQCQDAAVHMGTQQWRATLLVQVALAPALEPSAPPQPSRRAKAQRGKERRRETSTPATGQTSQYKVGVQVKSEASSFNNNHLPGMTLCLHHPRPWQREKVQNKCAFREQ